MRPPKKYPLVTYTRSSLNFVFNIYSNPTIFLKNKLYSDDNFYLIDDLREATTWLKSNTATNSKILSWWDYGYHLTELANRTTIIDNHTSNFTHIGIVGEIFSSSEQQARKMMNRHKLDVDYVVVNFGGLVGFENDDIDKFPWMIRVASETLSSAKNLSELDFMYSKKYFTISNEAPRRLTDSLLFKLCYNNFQTAKSEYFKKPLGYDMNRRETIGRKVRLKYFQEVYTSKNWLYRIYRVGKNDRCNRGFC